MKPSCTARLFAASMCAAVASMGTAMAQCQLKILAACPATQAGAPYNPSVGETYWLRVTWAVTGKPKGPYSILFKMADHSYKWTGLNTSQGSGYYGVIGFNLPLDGPIPWSITLDPDRVTGNTTISAGEASGTLTPTPPKTAVEYFNAQLHPGTETFKVDWKVGGTVTSGYTIMGAPTSGSFQTVDASTGPKGSKLVKTTPDGDYVWQTTRTNFSPTSTNHEWVDTTNFTVTCSSMRANIGLLRKVTWTQEAAVPSTITPYLKPDSWVQSTDSTTLALVKSTLPANYRTAMTPYDAAKALYMAVVKRTVYETPAAQDSKTTAVLKKGDCGSFTNLTCAALRSIGIPARANTGFWTGTDQWHVKGEFYLQNAGWIPFDGSESRLFDPTGAYPYFFGSDASLNNFCAVGRGDDHRTSQFAVTSTQVGWFYYSGQAAYGASADTSYLK